MQVGTAEGDVIVIRARTCRFTPSRGHVWTTDDADDIDGVAAFCPEVDACFFIPIADIAGRGYLHLRFAPARNHHRWALQWPRHTGFGAIAQLGERLNGIQEVAGSSPASSTRSSEATRTGGLSS
jgi:PD-(D/E)XK endonuclease